MKEVILGGLAKHIEEGTIQTWFFEEGDSISIGDDLVELSTEDGTVTIPSTAAGILAEVYYDEGEVVAKGETLCTIDDDSDEIEDKDADDDDDDDDDEEDEDDDDDDEEDADEEEEDKDE